MWHTLSRDLTAFLLIAADVVAYAVYLAVSKSIHRLLVEIILTSMA